MPSKRTFRARHKAYPDSVERLRRNLPIEESAENRQLMIEVGYFGDFSELGPKIEERALRWLRTWREETKSKSER